MNSPHEHRVRVRYGETDQMGVVHHSNYLHYMEEGRTRLMEDLGCAYTEIERRGFGLPVRRAELRFHSGARYDEELVVTTRLGRMRAASIVFRYEIHRAGGELVASGEIELACVNLTSPERRPVPLPDDLREILERLAQSDEPAL